MTLRYWWKIAKFLYPTCIYRPPRGWHRHNFVKIFGADKNVEWVGYHMVKKLWQYVKPFSSDTRTSRTDRHRRTDGHTMSDRQICYISIARQAQFSMRQWPLTLTIFLFNNNKIIIILIPAISYIIGLSQLIKTKIKGLKGTSIIISSIFILIIYLNISGSKGPFITT